MSKFDIHSTEGMSPGQGMGNLDASAIFVFVITLGIFAGLAELCIVYFSLWFLYLAVGCMASYFVGKYKPAIGPALVAVSFAGVALVEITARVLLRSCKYCEAPFVKWFVAVPYLFLSIGCGAMFVAVAIVGSSQSRKKRESEPKGS